MPTGEFVFINHDKPSTTKAQATKIRSHVHGAHRQQRKLNRVASTGRTTPLVRSAQNTQLSSERGDNEIDLPYDAHTSGLSSYSPDSPLRYGQSDPFSAAAIIITPTAHQLLSISYLWDVVRDYPPWTYHLYEQRKKQDQFVILRNALDDAGLLHCLLAAANLVKSLGTVGDIAAAGTFLLRAMEHKTIVLQRLQDRLKHDAMADVTVLIDYLAGMEVFEGNVQAVSHHRTALYEIIKRHPVQAHRLHHVWLTDVWEAYQRPARTSIDVDIWHPPRIVRQQEAHYLRLVGRKPSDLSQTSSVNLPNQQIMSSKILEMFDALHNYLSLKETATTLTPTSLQDEILRWLYLRFIAINGLLINRLYDYIDLSTANAETIRLPDGKVLEVAIILALILFVQIESNIMVDTRAREESKDSSQRSSPVQLQNIVMALRGISRIFVVQETLLMRLLDADSSLDQPELMLWLLFVSALIPSLTSPTASLVGATRSPIAAGFHRLTTDMQKDEIRRKLRTLLYVDAMDTLLDHLLAAGNDP